MPLMKVSKWIEDTFEPGSRPTANTVKSWIKSGQIHGEVIANKHYVSVNESGQNIVSDAKPVRVKVRL